MSSTACESNLLLFLNILIPVIQLEFVEYGQPAQHGLPPVRQLPDNREVHTSGARLGGQVRQSRVTETAGTQEDTLRLYEEEANQKQDTARGLDMDTRMYR